jgi:hypothetical protein
MKSNGNNEVTSNIDDTDENFATGILGIAPNGDEIVGIRVLFY